MCGILRFTPIFALINPIFCLPFLETKVNINITEQNIANSYQHFQQVFQQPAKLENTKEMSKTGGNYRTRKTHQVTKQILKKVNITDAGHFQRLRMQSRPVSAMEM